MNSRATERDAGPGQSDASLQAILDHVSLPVWVVDHDGTINHTLSGASAEARQVALAQLLGGLNSSEISDLQELARTVETKRKRRR